MSTQDTNPAEEGVISVATLEEAKVMYESQHMMKGIVPQTYIAQAEAEAKKEDETNALGEDENAPKVKATRMIIIPDDLFGEFKGGIDTERKENGFKDVAHYVVI
jgi:hypothetical protein